MTAIGADITQCVGGTQLVRLAPARARGRALRQARGRQPRRQRQGPHRRRDDRGRRARGADRAGPHDDRRGDVSGNTGIALAMVCAAKGYELVLTLPQGMSRERTALLRQYGARVELIDSMGGMTEAVDRARELARDADVFLPDQFSNPANPEVHRRTTGPEIVAALGPTVDALVAGVGTGGTITGVGEVLRASNPRCRIVAVEPASSAVLSGGPAGPHRIQGIGAGFVPAVLNREILDEVIAVSDERAIELARRAAREEGILAGISCGAALAGALELAVARRVRRQADRRDPAGLGRALHLDAVLRRVDGPMRAGAPQIAHVHARSLLARYASADARTAARDPPRPGRRPRARPVGARRAPRGDARDVAGAARADRPSRRPRAVRGARAAAAARDRLRRAGRDRDRDPPRRADRRGPLHRPRVGRGDRRDRGRRRRTSPSTRA